MAAFQMAVSHLQSLQNSLGRNWMPGHFQAASCHRHSPWLFRFVKVSTSSELYPDTFFFFFFFFFFFECLGIQFSNLHSCDLRDAMPCPRSSLSYSGKQRISLEVTVILNMFLCPHPQPDCNKFTRILNLYLCMSRLEKFCLQLRAAATLISNHESIEQQPH